MDKLFFFYISLYKTIITHIDMKYSIQIKKGLITVYIDCHHILPVRLNQTRHL